MALWGEPPKGALYWGGYNLVNFPSLGAPLRLSLCTCLVLSNWCVVLCVQILYLFCLRPLNPTINMLSAQLGFGIRQLASKTNYFHLSFLNFESQCILHKKFCKRAGKMTFKIEICNVINYFPILN